MDLIMKRILFLLLTILLAIGASAFSGEVEINGIKYYVVTKAKTAEVRANNYAGDIVIPSSITYEGIVCKIEKIGDNAFANCASLTSVTLPTSISSIGNFAFKNCDKLFSIELPSTISTIGKYAFMGCSGLSDFIIPSKVNRIEEGTFEECTGLCTVNIPLSVSQIGNRAFLRCSGLTTIDIPSSVTRIEGDTFAGCTGLLHVTIPSSIIYIGDRAFQDCTNLIYVALPTSIEYIGNGAFSNCSRLETVSIPPSIKTIEQYTFASCSGLRSLIIPSSVTWIYLYAFANCSELTDVYCYAEIDPRVDFGSNPFVGSEIEYATLHVPESSIEIYKLREPWKLFKETVKINPMFSLTFMVDDIVYISYQVEEGVAITPEYGPKKEGYSFIASNEIPETMPDNDVTVTGSFTVNTYTLTYMVDGEVYKTCQVDYGAAIIPQAFPTKTGYTFSGWNDIPSTMPAMDITISGTFTINTYKLSYIVDGVEYKTIEVEYDSTITPEENPTKEGHTFSGWSEIPETMPANDVTVTGSFMVNTYTLTYMVDGEVYKTCQVDYGTTIIPEAFPTITGYTFSGWSEIPETMPANDVTVTGSFTVNTYTLTYMVDDELYKASQVDYGTAITPEAAPTMTGHTFSGWSEIPENMPDHDVIVTGSFTVNKYQVTYIIDGEVFSTEYVEYGATIVPPNVEDKEGFTFSGWTNVPDTMPAHDLFIYGSFTSGIAEIVMATKNNVRIYSPNGKKINKMLKGLNIVVLEDGTVKKVVVK